MGNTRRAQLVTAQIWQLIYQICTIVAAARRRLYKFE